MGLSISLITTVIPLWSPCHHPCPCQSIPLATEERNLSKMQLPSQYPFPEIPQVLSHQDKTILRRACPSHNLPVQPSMACFHFWPLHMGEILCLKYLSLKTVPTYTPISLCLLTPNPSPLPLCSSVPRPLPGRVFTSVTLHQSTVKAMAHLPDQSSSFSGAQHKAWDSDGV